MPSVALAIRLMFAGVALSYCWDMNTWTSLSNEIEAAVEKAAPSIVQVHGHRGVTAGVVVADNLIVTPASTGEDKVAVLACSYSSRTFCRIAKLPAPWRSAAV